MWFGSRGGRRLTAIVWILERLGGFLFSAPQISVSFSRLYYINYEVIIYYIVQSYDSILPPHRHLLSSVHRCYYNIVILILGTGYYHLKITLSHYYSLVPSNTLSSVFSQRSIVTYKSRQCLVRRISMILQLIERLFNDFSSNSTDCKLAEWQLIE